MASVPELIATPSAGILHRSYCCYLRQCLEQLFRSLQGCVTSRTTYAAQFHVFTISKKNLFKLYDEEFSTHSFRTLAGVVFGE